MIETRKDAPVAPAGGHVLREAQHRDLGLGGERVDELRDEVALHGAAPGAVDHQRHGLRCALLLATLLLWSGDIVVVEWFVPVISSRASKGITSA